MQVINIDVAGRQTFFCVGRQYEKSATVLYFRGLQLSSGAQVYLSVGGQKYSLAANSFVVNEHLTHRSGDYKAKLIVKDGDSETIVRIFTFRVDATSPKTREIDGENLDVLTEEECQRVVAEYVNDNQQLLKGDPGAPGGKGDPGKDGKDAVLNYSEKDLHHLNIPVTLSGKTTLTILGIHQQKSGHLVSLTVNALVNSEDGEEDFTSFHYSANLSEYIKFLPQEIIPLTGWGWNDAAHQDYLDITGLDTAAISPDGTLKGNMTSGTVYLQFTGMYLVADSGKLE